MFHKQVIKTERELVYHHSTELLAFWANLQTQTKE